MSLAIQKLAENLGNFGCYFLCILKKFNEEENCVRWYRKAVGLQYMNADCFLNRPDQVAQMVSKKRWSVRKEGPDYVCKPGEWEVLRYERKTPGTTYAHFVLPDWDPLGESLTRSQGQLVSKRIFKEL